MMMTNVLGHPMMIVTMKKNNSHAHLPLTVMTISSHDHLHPKMMKMTNRFRRLLMMTKTISLTHLPPKMTMINLFPQPQSQYLSQFLNLLLNHLSQRVACLEDQ